MVATRSEASPYDVLGQDLQHSNEDPQRQDVANEILYWTHRFPRGVSGTREEMQMRNDRAAFLVGLRRVLLAGAPPTSAPVASPVKSPDPVCARSVLKWLQGTGLNLFTKENEAMVEAVLRDVIEFLVATELALDGEDAQARIEELAKKLLEEEEERERRKKKKRQPPPPSFPGGGAGGGGFGDASAAGQGFGDGETGDGEGDGDAEAGDGDAASGDDEGDGDDGEGEARRQARNARGRAGAHTSGGGSNVELSKEQVEELFQRARASARATVKQEVADKLLEGTAGPWEERTKLWRELKDVFDDLTNFMDVGWDLTSSLLRSQGWREVKRLHETVKQLPKLRELLEALGRMVEGRAGGKGQIVTVYEEVQRKVETRVEKLVPDVPEEICGITQGDDISRMLPSEAMLLATDVPVLQTLWHVKRLERSMLQYHMQGVDLDTVMTDQKQMEGKEEEKPAGMGPIIACLDTSGSMSGFPEQVAKALVLEGIKTASRESRKFYLINFSGPENTQALEMSAGPEGIQNLIGLLLGSFHGGTDVHAPLVEAIKQLRAEGGEWDRADVVVVSDGGFSVPSGVLPRMQEAREEHGVRFHGVLIGNYDSPAMTALCDEGCLHKFSSWNSLGGV